jgi:PAS domain S-box-containing protein
VANPLRKPSLADQQQSEKKFRLLVESVQDYSIFMLDREGRVQTWNAGAKRMKGYEAHEIIGQHFSVFYPEGNQIYTELLRQADVRGRAENEGWRVRKDGSRFWADVVLTALRSDDGELVGFTKVTRDLTERRAAEERLRRSEERFRLLVEAVEDYGIFMLDPDGKVASWNAGAERIKQYRADEIIGQHFSRFYPEEDVRAGKCELELKTAAAVGRFEDEGWRLRKDGSRFWANVVLTPVRDKDGVLLGFSKVTRDLTERRKLEQERLRTGQAEEAIRLRDEFLSIASHELRTPLTALQLQLLGLRTRVAGLDEKVIARVDKASRSGERLADLIETLMDVTRIATGRLVLNLDTFDLEGMAREILERMRETADLVHCDLIFEGNGPLTGRWDRMRLEQVLTNLLANAVKYASGAPVELSVHLEDGTAVLEVRDHGPGIPADDVHRIFERFERAASMRNFGGMGLGLYVTRQIVEAHGGGVAARNLEDGGACFTVRLPLITPGKAPEGPPVAEPR